MPTVGDCKTAREGCLIGKAAHTMAHEGPCVGMDSTSVLDYSLIVLKRVIKDTATFRPGFGVNNQTHRRLQG